jgi:AmmeMemoRadiSam system protein A
MLSSEQGLLLLRIARNAIDNCKDIPNKLFLREKRGVFVTLTIHGELRGCIGLPYPVRPLGEAVSEAAVSAAYSDPRFNPLTETEKKLVKLEISVLTEPVPCKLTDIKKGDGVILLLGSNSALFLPQVWDELSDKTFFLEQLSMKAGLEKDDYKNASYKRFSVQIFHE